MLAVVAVEVLKAADSASPITQVEAVMQQLEDPHWDTRTAALAELKAVDPAALSEYLPTVVQRLVQSDWRVRRAALEVLKVVEYGITLD